MPRSSHEMIIHKAKNHAYVKIKGRLIALGPADDPNTEVIYHQVMLDFLMNKYKVGRTVSVLCAKYLKHAEVYYRHGSQVHTVKSAIKYLCAVHGDSLAERFGPRELKHVRESLIQHGLARRTINALVNQMRRIWKWAAAEGIVPHTVYQSLCALDGLRRGRSAARETDPVTPVSEEHINAVRPYVSDVIWAMIQTQLLTGARPGEIIMLKIGDIDRSGSVWTATLTEHKEAWREAKRTLYFGPKAQEILRPWLLRAPSEYLWSPRETMRRLYEKAMMHRRPGQTTSVRRTDRVVGEHYTGDSYRRAITRACEKAGIPQWHPHQLRHTAATLVRKEHGLEAAQVILGHATADVTQIYAERNEALAKAIALKMG